MLRVSSLVQPKHPSYQRQQTIHSEPRWSPPLEAKDAFTRSGKLNFSGNSQSSSSASSAISSDSDSEDAPVPEQIWKKLRNKSSVPGSLPVLGRGMESIVYKVSDKFVFRVPMRYEGTNWDIPRNRIFEHPDNEPELREFDNIGKPVAKIYYDAEPIFFHKFMSGEKASINYNHLTLDGRIPDGEETAFDNKYLRYLKTVSEFPRDSYLKLLWTVHQLDKEGYAIDPGANNLMVDADKQKFSIVDYKRTKDALRNNMFPVNEQNNIAYQMAMLIDAEYTKKSYIPESWPQRDLCRQIIKKTLLAAAQLKYTYNASVKMPSNTFHLCHVNDKSSNSFTPEEIFKFCGFKESGWKEIRKALIEQEKGSYESYSKTSDTIIENLKQ